MPATAAITEKVKAIAAAPFLPFRNHVSKSLLSGLMGRAILTGYLFKYTGEEVYRTECAAITEECMDALAEEAMTHTYCNGITGIAAGLHHLAALGLLEEDPILLLEDIDAAIHAFTLRDFETANWDFLHGGLGGFWYFLNRPDFAGHSAYFEQYLRLLDTLAEPTPRGCRWAMKPLRPEDEGEKIYSVGLSHGLPSIIMVLAQCVKKDICLPLSKPMLRKACNHLLSLQLPEGMGSVFPAMEAEGESLRASRLAWCYGDLSIAIVLYAAAEALADEQLGAMATHTAMATLTRDYSNTSLADAAFCHGTGGVAVLYLRLYKITGKPLFMERFRFWIDATLQLATHEDGIAGYKSFMGEEGFLCQPGLLEGVTGTGLCLLAALQPEETAWDTFFLLA